ncbi:MULTISPECIES: low specificity L-threonine aldolase [Micromonospora]|uniref:Threonine aldolase n=1 Tax=Micromonospora solifontis TaxID=2487138 RepID=A0ABX9W8L9_9ACTN|nr:MULTISPECIES: beta-eliminating lyase-related protein [Micromonospora]NES12665.1 threonine aldolase [Micromonospora sp. PPF5-17B]NES39613.1 threonine aldolase [Micromonospora solifontis]NES54450.1 threonine aldolase [Micromonospora sp. PPF5-6]RNL87924.1 threonine aldolase [Micromonospora solifontis]
MTDERAELARRFAAQRGCGTMLSGIRPPSVREQLAVLGESLTGDPVPDFYGEGGPVEELEGRVAELLGAEAVAFFPTGTMAQQIALRYGAELTGRDGVGLHPLSHPVLHERDALVLLAGLRTVRTTDAPRNPTAGEVAALDEPIGTLMLELPLRDAGFVLPTWDELTAVVAAARARGARVHLDGARLWESTVHLGHPLAEIAALADSTYVSFYKSLKGHSGAALAGDAELVRYARAWRHRHGGNLFQQWPAALAALAGLAHELPRLPDYVAHAKVVAAALATLPGARVHPEPPHTHQFRLWLPHPAEALNEANLALAEEERAWFVGGWRDTEVPGVALAEVTVAGPALELDADRVVDLADRFLRRLPQS